MFVIFLCISAAVFFTGAAWAVKMKQEDRIPWQSFLLIMLLFTAIAMWITVLPLVREGSLLYKPLYAAFYVLESAIGNVDYSLFSEALAAGSFWRIYTIFLHLLMPITTYGVILVYFMKAFGWFRYTMFRGKKKIIIFSELTDKSRAYAGRIDAKDTLLIFCNTEDGEKQHFSEESAKNMIFTDQSEIQVLKQLRKQDLTIMEMGENDEANLQKSVEIIRYFEKEANIPPEDKKTINLYTVSCQPEAATIMDNVMMRGIDGNDPLTYHQTVINEFKRIAFKLLNDDPLYKFVDDHSKQLDIMIVGFGRMGQELLKAISWAGCFPGIDTNVHVISRKAIENGELLLSHCPELGIDLSHNHGFLTPENGNQLNHAAPIYYYSTETRGPKFDNIIRCLAHCRYIVVSLGDDATTLETALTIYRLIMRESYQRDIKIEPPEIHVRIRDDENLQLFSSKEDISVFSHFKNFGSDEDIYSKNQVGRSDLDHLARRVRNIYRRGHDLNDEKSKYSYLPETEKNANQAAALHVLYKLHFFEKVDVKEIKGPYTHTELEMINAASRKVYETLVSEEDKEQAANWEHIRWQAYMRTEGYVHCSYENTEKIYKEFHNADTETAYKKTKVKLGEARMHPTIGDPKGKNEEHLRKVSMLISNQKDPNHFHKNDRRFVDSIPQIIHDIYEIVPKPEEEKKITPDLLAKE